MSVFDDPGDEKSWHQSQRSESLLRYYEGRQPSWYASAVRPLQGADRVLDLGCGPGLALDALREQGATHVVGVDRWRAFERRRDPRVIAHDLTLPMPFLAPGSFDGVLSHYALDYVSPIGMRQVLREACRVLAPGGRLVMYTAAVGLGSGDVTRTVPYTPEVLRPMLEEAGFADIEANAPADRRNTSVVARSPTRGPDEPTATADAEMAVDGDAQMSCAFAGQARSLSCRLAAGGRTHEVTLDVSGGPAGDSRVLAVCARVVRRAPRSAELQLWAWRDGVPVAIGCTAVDFEPEQLRVVADVPMRHRAEWAPRATLVETAGNAYARSAALADGRALSEAERGGEGRQVVVERTRGEVSREGLGPGMNRFVVKRHADLGTIDSDWLAGHVHGVVVDVEDLASSDATNRLLWADQRQAMVYLEGRSWDDLAAALAERCPVGSAPVVLVDPSLSASAAGPPPPPEVIAAVQSRADAFAVLAGPSVESLSAAASATLDPHLLPSGQTRVAPSLDASENLRYMTERVLLTALQQRYGRSWQDVGRRVDAVSP